MYSSASKTSRKSKDPREWTDEEKRKKKRGFTLEINKHQSTEDQKTSPADKHKSPHKDVEIVPLQVRYTQNENSIKNYIFLFIFRVHLALKNPNVQKYGTAVPCKVDAVLLMHRTRLNVHQLHRLLLLCILTFARQLLTKNGRPLDLVKILTLRLEELPTSLVVVFVEKHKCV